VELQDEFYLISLVQFQAGGNFIVHHPMGMTDPERSVWNTINIFFSQCERSLAFLSPLWEKYEGGGEDSRE
jgi:hypothetical protein